MGHHLVVDLVPVKDGFLADRVSETQNQFLIRVEKERLGQHLGTPIDQFGG